MKNILIIICILSIIFSCKTTKINIVKNEKMIKDSLFVNDTIIIVDSDGDGILDQNDVCPNEYGLDSNGCQILSKMIIEINEIQNNEKINNDKSNPESFVTSKIKKHESKTNSKVIDYSTKDTTKGWIAYSVPKEMQVSKSYSIKVRISKKTSNQNKATLVIGDGYSINNPNLPSIVSIEDIKVSGEMNPELISEPDAFKINLLSTPTQNIDNESYTEWEWNVTPLKSGNTTLKLIIKIKEINKDIVVFNRNISVKSNVPVAVEGFFEKYWQWIMSTFIIPIFLFFWNRKKKSKRRS